jgi:hypothetical protein
MDELLFYAFQTVVLLYLVTCYLVYRYSHWYWGHDFFSFKSFLVVTVSCWLIWAALYGDFIQGDLAARHRAKGMLVAVGVVLYAGVVIYNIYKTGFVIGLFGSVIQTSVYVVVALYFYKGVIVFLAMIPCFHFLRGGAGRVETITETVYRNRHY